ncbi:ParR family transcriptional regulator [Corchorus capsularis]|uniref:ParR family transcriptional regulator n=1 Tax=Corchorus capsularis TaxID=210143 RepID=A0A1R3JK67_COCAP|nr:ParR family transcriptional regulator [Corchorus capsularis]
MAHPHHPIFVTNPTMVVGARRRRGVEEAKGRLRRIRKRIRLGKGASWNKCSSTLANSTVYSSINSATIATRIISFKLV